MAMMLVKMIVHSTRILEDKRKICFRRMYNTKKKLTNISRFVNVMFFLSSCLSR